MGTPSMGPAQIGASFADLISTLKGVVTNLSALNTTIGAALPRITGTFTLAAATTTVVTQPSITSGSKVLWSATNGTAALTVRTSGLFHSANTPGASFSMSTQSGSALGGETFEYVVVNPS